MNQNSEPKEKQQELYAQNYAYAAKTLFSSHEISNLLKLDSIKSNQTHCLHNHLLNNSHSKNFNSKLFNKSSPVSLFCWSVYSVLSIPDFLKNYQQKISSPLKRLLKYLISTKKLIEKKNSVVKWCWKRRNYRMWWILFQRMYVCVFVCENMYKETFEWLGLLKCHKQLLNFTLCVVICRFLILFPKSHLTHASKFGFRSIPFHWRSQRSSSSVMPSTNEFVSKH